MARPGNRQRRVLGCVVAALLLSSLLRPGAAGFLSGLPRHGVEAVVGLASGPVKGLADAVRRSGAPAIDRGGAWELERNYDALLTYNARLRGEVERLAEELEQHRLVRQRSRLEGVDFRLADVVGYWEDRTRRVMRIGCGSGQGVAAGMVVVDCDQLSLVGRVTDAGPVTATVDLVTSPGTRVEARFLPSKLGGGGVEARLVAGITAEKGGRRFIATVKGDFQVEAGYLAHLADQSWPEEGGGFVIGKVVSVEADPENRFLYRRVVVEPVRGLGELRRVVVLVPVGRGGSIAGR